MKKVGIYACITNDLRSLVRIQRYCDYNLITQYEVFIDKVDNLRDLKNRSALKELKQKIKNKEIDFVVIDDISSISTKMRFNIDFINYVEKHEVKISDTTSVKHLNFCKTLCSVMLDEESRKIKIGREMAKRFKENNLKEELER